MQCLLAPGRAFQAGTSRFVKWQWWLQTLKVKSIVTASSVRTWCCGSCLEEGVKLFLSPTEKVPLKTAPISLQKSRNIHPGYVQGPFSTKAYMFFWVWSPVNHSMSIISSSRTDCSSLALLKEIQHQTGPGSANPTGSSRKLRRLWSWATLALSQLHIVSPLSNQVALSCSEAQQIIFAFVPRFAFCSAAEQANGI